MKKSTKALIIIGSILLVIGLVLGFISLVAVDFNLSTFLHGKVYTQRTVDVDIQPTDRVVISLETDKVHIGVSEDDMAHLTYYETEGDKRIYAYENGELSLKIDRSAEKWYRHLVFNFEWSERTVELLLPADFAGQIDLRCTTGNIKVDSLNLLSELSIVTTTGNADVVSTEADKIIFAATTGNVELENTLSGQIEITTTTGNVKLTKTDSEWLTVTTTTGNVKLDDVNGDIINITATTGSVKGNLLAKQEEYSISVHTTTGNSNLVSSHGGARTLTVNTTTGNVNITFSK